MTSLNIKNNLSTDLIQVWSAKLSKSICVRNFCSTWDEDEDEEEEKKVELWFSLKESQEKIILMTVNQLLANAKRRIF